MTGKIKIIDLFAGPGGLGEGFAAQPEFDIAVSIEKESSAHRTLTLRSFFRQFEEAPSEYYDFLKGKLGTKPEDQLYQLTKFKRELERARDEARILTLGEDNQAILNAIDQKVGSDECILIGGPPCQAYSLVGRARNKGIKDYVPEQDNRSFLYEEYLKIIARYQPLAFVMENVKGMLSAELNGSNLFETIRSELEHPSKATGTMAITGKQNYKYELFSFVQDPRNDLFNHEHQDPKNFIIKMEQYGIPQKRHRVIILGLREDIASRWNSELCLIANSDTPTLKRAIEDLPKLRSGLSKIDNTAGNWLEFLNQYVPELTVELNKLNRSIIADEMQSYVSRFTSPVADQGANLGLKKTRKGRLKNSHPELARWIFDEKMANNICNHQSRGHIEQDLLRYLFCSTWAKLAHEYNWPTKSPKSHDFPDILKPAHKNFNSGKFSDRFRVQVANDAATTITSHISKDGHYFIHYDPLQCRSLTVREAARVQTFPDNYFFVGNRTQQYVQVGNAVPPFVASQIAKLVSGLI